jgi:predicted aminopeptidase
LLKLLSIVLAAFQLGGCYLMQAATGQMEIAMRREPIAELLADPATPDALRKRLEYVSAARDFASSELGLPNNGTYRSYAALDRPYVVWNVFATEEFSVEPVRWCFPIAGCVVYRGYFDEDDAQRYARKLRMRGYDTAVGGVAAYSTLGHFEDPVLSTMLGWNDVQLAATLFHELAHQVVYVPGDSKFNEAFATVVEEVGLERWLASRERSKDLALWRTQRKRHAEFVDLLLDAREELRELYKSGLPEEEMRAKKQYRFGKLKLEYSSLKKRWNGYSGYDRWFDRTLNNAHLVSAATYYGCVPAFEDILDSVGGNLIRFYGEVEALARPEQQDRRRAICEIRLDENGREEVSSLAAGPRPSGS